MRPYDLIAGILVAAIVCGLLIAVTYWAWLLTDNREEIEEQQRLWDGAVVLRICRDGTRIFRLHDGRVVVGGWMQTPDPGRTPEEICS